MSLDNLWIKGAINISGQRPEILKMLINPDNSYNSDSPCPVFIFTTPNGEVLKIEFVKNNDLCILKNIVYPEGMWCETGLLMALSVIFNVTGLSYIKVVSEHLFELMERFFIIGSAFPEIKLSKSKYGSDLTYDIIYSEQGIVISHGNNAFSLSSGKSVLDSALESGIELKYMCKSGICMRCRKKIISGACMELCEIEEGIIIRPEFLLTCNYKALTSLIIG